MSQDKEEKQETTSDQPNPGLVPELSTGNPVVRGADNLNVGRNADQDD